MHQNVSASRTALLLQVRCRSSTPEFAIASLAYIAHCWTGLFEQHGANMLKVTQTFSANSALMKYRVTLQGGKEIELVCHPASGKVTEAEQEHSR